MELLLIEVSCGYSVRQVSYYSVLFIIVVPKAIVFRSLISWLLLSENEGQNMHTEQLAIHLLLGYWIQVLNAR